MNRTILQGDVLDKLKEIPSESIDCIISSPPYWGLRDYGTGKWEGGTDPNCDHKDIRRKTREERGKVSDVQAGNKGGYGDESKWKSKICSTCNAHYEDGQLGLEPDFRDYLKKMSQIMDELKRVLKKTGTCWINLGDSYGTHRSNEESLGIGYEKQERKPLKGFEKCRIGIPERFYINCIDDGWIARNHIPWYKANSMPSSVKDRFTNKWESIFFFAKNQKYYFNLDAVREKTITESKPFKIRVRENITGHAQAKLGDMVETASDEEKERDNRDGIIKEKYADKPQSNVARLYKDRPGNPHTSNDIHQDAKNAKNRKHSVQTLSKKVTGGYYEDGTNASHPNGKNPGDVFFIHPKPFTEAHFATFPIELPEKILKCACPHDGIVLDPFFGAGTVGVAAEKLGLQWCGIELNDEYIKIAEKRLEKYKHEKLEMWS